MNKKTIFLDIDGTLVDYEMKLPESARNAVEQARSNGNIVLVCSGRSKYEIVKDDLPKVDGIIGGNGAFIEFNNEVIMHVSLSENDESNIVDYLNKNKKGYFLECNSGMYANKDTFIKLKLATISYIKGKSNNVSSAEELANKILNDYTKCECKEQYREDVNKISYTLDSYNDFINTKNMFPNLVHNTWGGKDAGVLFGDISPIGISKQNAIKKVLEYLNISKENTISFGDAKIDLSMFELCSINVAMGNACKELKEKATYITDNVENDGLYNAFKHLKII